MSKKITCPNCHHHDFEVKPKSGSRSLDILEKVLLAVGAPVRWFSNVLMRCRTCSYNWRA